MIKKHSQQGLTTIGWIAVIAIFGMIVVTGFKILPFYLEYYQVRTVLESLVTDESIDAKSRKDIWVAIRKRLLINSVRGLTKEDFTFFKQFENQF